MGRGDAMDEDQSLVFLGLDRNAIVDEDGAAIGGKAGKKFPLHVEPDAWFLSMPYRRFIGKADSF